MQSTYLHRAQNAEHQECAELVGDQYFRKCTERENAVLSKKSGSHSHVDSYSFIHCMKEGNKVEKGEAQKSLGFLNGASGKESACQ